MFGEFNTHREHPSQEKQRKSEGHILGKSKSVKKHVLQKQRSVVKEQVLVDVTKAKKLCTTIFSYVLNGNATQRNRKKRKREKTTLFEFVSKISAKDNFEECGKK